MTDQQHDDEAGEVFEGEAPPEGFDLSGEEARAEEAASEGVVERPGEPEFDPDPDSAPEDEGAADDDGALDEPDVQVPDEEVV